MPYEPSASELESRGLPPTGTGCEPIILENGEPGEACMSEVDLLSAPTLDAKSPQRASVIGEERTRT